VGRAGGGDGGIGAAPPRIDFAHPANAAVLRFLGVSDPARARTNAPSEVDGMRLGTHPDLVEYLWKLAAPLARACACVIDERSYPLLAHPGNGVIFGLAGGTSTLALRLPEPELAEALAVPGYGREYRYPSSTVHAADMGDEWALVRPFGAANSAWCARAFGHAATHT
jgi:hypothetical protein